MIKRPNKTNPADMCCCCYTRDIPTPKNHLDPQPGELHVWQPNDSDPPQWICADCKKRLEAEA